MCIISKHTLCYWSGANRALAPGNIIYSAQIGSFAFRTENVECGLVLGQTNICRVYFGLSADKARSHSQSSHWASPMHRWTSPELSKAFLCKSQLLCIGIIKQWLQNQIQQDVFFSKYVQWLSLFRACILVINTTICLLLENSANVVEEFCVKFWYRNSAMSASVKYRSGKWKFYGRKLFSWVVFWINFVWLSQQRTMPPSKNPFPIDLVLVLANLGRHCKILYELLCNSSGKKK